MKVRPVLVLRMSAVLFLSLTGAMLLAPRHASAQEAASVQGTFAWDSTASDDVAEAIDEALADVNFLHRRFARRHLRSENEPYRTVTIEQDESTVSITTDGGEPIRAPVSGEPVEWTRADGKRMRVSIVREKGAIRQTFTLEDGERVNLFSPSADRQTLTLEVTVRMNRGHGLIRYELLYRMEQ